jgi:plastocyanin
MMLPTNILLLAGIAGQAIGATIPVSVGKTGLTFEPNIIKAAQGDVIEFRFWPRNHSVVAGEFTSACKPANQGGFFSGFFPTQPGTVNVRIPIPNLLSHPLYQ